MNNIHYVYVVCDRRCRYCSLLCVTVCVPCDCLPSVVFIIGSIVGAAAAAVVVDAATAAAVVIAISSLAFVLLFSRTRERQFNLKSHHHDQPAA